VVKAFQGLEKYDKDNVLTPYAKKKFEELEKKYDIAKPSYKAMDDNIMKSLHEITRSRHISSAAVTGTGIYGLSHLTALFPFAGAGAALGRGLGSKGLLEAYTKGVIPGEKAAAKIAPKVAKAAKMGVSLTGLSYAEGVKASEEFEKRRKKRLEDLKRRR